MARDPITRGVRDEATVGPNPSSARDLKRLSELRYEVADGEPDIRGWRVFASTGREVGVVSDLLIDTIAGEVVMLDVDLLRERQHTFAPIRAAWVDHATRRVVLDARAVEDATASGTTDALPLATTPVAAAPEVLPPTPRAVELPAGVPASDPLGVPVLSRGGPLSDADIQRFNDDYVRAYGDRAADRDATWRVPHGTDEALQFTPRRLMEPGGVPVTRADAPLAEAPLAERRAMRVDDASALDDSGAIDPRELDARVRIDEGATVDEAAPVAGVRYPDGEPHPAHDYGTPDEAYGPGHGSGRIGFNRVVTRERYVDDATAPENTPRAVRYRQYDDRYAGPDSPSAR